MKEKEEIREEEEETKIGGGGGGGGGEHRSQSARCDQGLAASVSSIQDMNSHTLTYTPGELGSAQPRPHDTRPWNIP